MRFKIACFSYLLSFFYERFEAVWRLGRSLYEHALALIGSFYPLHRFFDIFASIRQIFVVEY